ncbi:hypothetical protein [Haloechinothrix salitolerans]|uniref:hypothetical protein n=1 Tax=Haloechinothrix salitolerans TaxID=926830 RepID=UPI0036F2F1C3
MLIGSRVEYRHVDSGRLLDDGHKVAQRLHPEVIVAAELDGCGTAFGFGVHRLT